MACRSETAALVLLFALASMASAQTCHACGDDGRIDCTKHGKGWPERERAVRFCSVAAACKVCGGALETDCKQCRNAEAEAAIAQRLTAIKQWRDHLAADVDAYAKGDPLEHIQTDHVDLSFNIKQLTVGKEKLDTHAAMHLYADRIEALRAMFLEQLELKENDFASRLRVFMCKDGTQAAALAPHVTGMGGNQAVGTKLMGVDTVYCMWQNPRSLPDDDALYRNIVHNVTHLLTSNLAPPAYFGNPGNGWLDEGIAHWFEDRIGGKCTNFCFEEVLMQDGASFKGGRWRVPVRKIADEGKLVSLATLAPKNSDQLTFPEHAQSLAMVDYLLAIGGGSKLRDFVRLLKKKQPMRDAMQQVYGTNPLAFDGEFDAWVKATYPPQEPPR